MATRITSADLEQIVNVIRNATGRPYCLRTGYGKVGLSYEIGDKGGIRDVTGLMTKGELSAWINAYAAGIDEGRDTKLPTEPEGPYCVPQEAGLNSEASAVGRTIARLLESLGTVNRWICEGPIEDDCRALAMRIRERLSADGWRIKITASDRWSVLPPKSR